MVRRTSVEEPADEQWRASRRSRGFLALPFCSFLDFLVLQGFLEWYAHNRPRAALRVPGLHQQSASRRAVPLCCCCCCYCCYRYCYCHRYRYYVRWCFILLASNSTALSLFPSVALSATTPLHPTHVNSTSSPASNLRSRPSNAYNSRTITLNEPKRSRSFSKKLKYLSSYQDYYN